MAVLTQLHVALAGFEEARAQYATARRIADTQDGIVAALRSGTRLGVMDELEAVLAELEAVQTGLARDLAFAKIEDGFGRIFATAGADIVPDGNAAMTPGGARRGHRGRGSGVDAGRGLDAALPREPRRMTGHRCFQSLLWR